MKQAVTSEQLRRRVTLCFKKKKKRLKCEAENYIYVTHKKWQLFISHKDSSIRVSSTPLRIFQSQKENSLDELLLKSCRFLFILRNKIYAIKKLQASENTFDKDPLILSSNLRNLPPIEKHDSFEND